MNPIKLYSSLICILFVTILFAQPKEKNNYSSSSVKQKEFRAVWVATVGNIDWPTKTGLSADQQKQEFLTILDNVQKWKLNAIVVQVKPSSDAFYKSKMSPWSKYLTGKQGVNPGYDPLEFMIEEAHKRNIEIHAWFNPFRLSAGSTNLSTLSLDNIAYKHPDWVVRYGDQLYLNPGIPEVSDYVIESIMEVVKNYNIDGVHLDDYFYPYKIGKLEYPDYKEYAKYGVTFANKSDWRRDNINKFIKKLHQNIKKEKKKIDFGVSPFGVWRNVSSDPLKGSKTRALQNYDDLFADVLYWMENNWIDYVAPQLYWHRGNSTADYTTLIEWWNNAAKETKTKLYVGLAAYRVSEWKKEDELIQQIFLNRNFTEVKGNIFFSYRSLVRNPKDIIHSLLSGPFASE